MHYRTRDGDMLDRICFDYYGKTNHRIVEQVLEANPSLADKGVILKTGIIITLPELEATPSTASKVNLWD